MRSANVNVVVQLVLLNCLALKACEVRLQINVQLPPFLKLAAQNYSFKYPPLREVTNNKKHRMNIQAVLPVNYPC